MDTPLARTLLQTHGSWLPSRALPVLHHLQGMDDLPRLTTTTFIGIMVAITGNVLISLALNLQKLAHKRVKEDRAGLNEPLKGRRVRNGRNDAAPTLDEQDEDREHASGNAEEDVFLDSPQPSTSASSEVQPLILFPHTPQGGGYGAASDSPAAAPPLELKPKRTSVSRFIPLRFRTPRSETKTTRVADAILPVDVMSEAAALHSIPINKKKQEQGKCDEEENEGDYLKSKLWWLGFLLMNLGEVGNFISYAYAPASVVAPLGTFALMANCLFAPLLLGERFRKRDLLGILIAIIGAVTVVLSTNASDTRLNPDALIRAICQLPFIVFTGIYIAGALLLSTLSESSIGRNWVFVDVGLCALFGGFTVLSTKALSTLLTMQWIEVFTLWITYPIVAVLVLTGIGQIKYLNRALMRFDSKVVIPIQFVLFTLSAIFGSAILYGDFKKAKFHEIVTFLYGCAATFAGVFIIAWGPTRAEENGEDGNSSDGMDASAADGSTVTSGETPRLGLGTLGRRRRATLVLPSGVGGVKDFRETPSLRRKHSALSLIGISPAQHLLLVHTPPREIPPFRLADDERDIERNAQSPNYRRRRTTSWIGNDDGSGAGTRESSIAGRLRNGVGSNTVGRVGSLPDGQPAYR